MVDRYSYTLEPYRREVERQERAELRRRLVMLGLVVVGGLIFWTGLFGLVGWIIR